MEYRVAVRRVLGCAVVLLLAFTACNGGDDDTASPTTTAPSTTTTGPADPYAIPDTIDVAYVQRVIDKLYEIEAEAVRLIVAERELVPAAAERLAAVFLQDELNAQLRNWGDLIPSGLDDFRSDPGVVRTTINEVPNASTTCIFVDLTENFDDVAASPAPPGQTYLVLRPKAPAQDPASRNPTPWMIGMDVVSIDGGAPPDPCG